MGGGRGVDGKSGALGCREFEQTGPGETWHDPFPGLDREERVGRGRGALVPGDALWKTRVPDPWCSSTLGTVAGRVNPIAAKRGGDGANGLEMGLARDLGGVYFCCDRNNRIMPALGPVQQKFVLHWGEMGTRWGINRTVAQIHALLYTSPRPLHAEEITETLQVARSNVSNSLRELQAWGVVRLVHVMGDKRDHFESMKDVWEMFRVVLDERKKREIDPTIAMLRECVAEASSDTATDAYTEGKLRELADFFELTGSWYGQIRNWPTPVLAKFMKLGDKVRKLLGTGE